MTKPRSVFITGGNRGIGLGLVKLINEQFKPEVLFVTYRTPDNAKELIEYAAQNSNLHLIELDVREITKYPEVVDQVRQVTKGFGINLLINNAGIMEGRSRQTLSLIDKAALLTHFEINCMVPILLTQALLPLLEEASGICASAPWGIGRAVVANISTLMASIQDNGSGGSYAYRCSKAALNMATKSMSIDLKEKKIVAVVIHPGWVQTDMGGANASISIDTSVGGIVTLLDTLNESHLGGFYNYDGKELPW